MSMCAGDNLLTPMRNELLETTLAQQLALDEEIVPKLIVWCFGEVLPGLLVALANVP
jgi:hypothetical protein